MRDFLIGMLQTPENPTIDITLFSIWHIMYVGLILGITAAIVFLFRNKKATTQNRLLSVLALLPIFLYAADYLIMPLAYGAIDIDKLPFHFCTLLSILILPIRFGQPFRFWKEPITVLCIVTPLMYLCYPGTAIGDISPFCYRVIQTFLYHGSVFLYGIASVALGDVKLEWRNIGKAAILITVILCWGALGNAVYSTPSHAYDWCFVAGHTFPFIPKMIMPTAVLFAVLGLVCIIYAIAHGLGALQKKKESIAHGLGTLPNKRKSKT